MNFHSVTGRECGTVVPKNGSQAVLSETRCVKKPLAGEASPARKMTAAKCVSSSDFLKSTCLKKDPKKSIEDAFTGAHIAFDVTV